MYDCGNILVIKWLLASVKTEIYEIFSSSHKICFTENGLSTLVIIAVAFVHAHIIFLQISESEYIFLFIVTVQFNELHDWQWNTVWNESVASAAATDFIKSGLVTNY